MKKLIAWILILNTLLLMTGCSARIGSNTPKVSAMTEPPQLTVISGDTSIKALLGTYSWTYELTGGKSQSVCADGAHPLESKKYIESPLPFTTTDDSPEGLPSVTLQFGIAPDSITINGWPTFYFGDSSATSENIPITGSSFKLRDRDYVYEVIATWDSNKHGFGGTAYYSFYTVKHVSENEPTTCAPEASEANDKTITNIVDTSKGNPDLAFAMALEPIYEDNTAVYCLSCIKSHYIIVHYADGSQEDVKTALNSGRATIADLDRFGIGYYREAK